MPQYSEQDLKYAAELRDEIHNEALAIVRKTRPNITEVIDRHPVEDYFQENWEYPGKWYTIVAIPYGYKNRKAFVDTIVRDTLSGRVPENENTFTTQELRDMAKDKPRNHKISNQLNTKPDGYSELFVVEVDQKNHRSRAVGVDNEGRYILEQYEEYAIGSTTDSTSAYYVLSDLGYNRYARLALLNGQLKEEEYDRLTNNLKTHKQKGNQFYSLIAEYPDLVVDYCIIDCKQNYSGYESHRKALKSAYDKLCKEWNGNPDKAMGKRIAAEQLFSSKYQHKKLNYRRAFLYPPHQNSYTGKDFVRVNNALFPNGTDGLEAYEWNTDWSDYFDDGHEWWSTLCLTVYDKTLDRFAVIMASATD